MTKARSLPAVTRQVTLVLVDADGGPLGALPSFPVEVPWWPEVAEIVAIARERWALDLAVLRVLGAPDRPGPPGGEVTYAAEVLPGTSALPPLVPAGQLVESNLAPHPFRAPWAAPGGPIATVSWAGAELARLGTPYQDVQQRKTWNLSAIWRLRTADGPVWIKEVPSFFSHEPAVLRWVGSIAPFAVPRLLASCNGRMLLAHVPGEDRFGAPATEVAEMLADLHEIQAYATGHVRELRAIGVPDRRGDATQAMVGAVVGAYAPGLEPDLRGALDGLVEGLPERLAAVAACGVPDTLVHGDFHPGNVRREVDSDRRVIIDWGDSTVGHPAMDIARACSNVPAADAGPLADAWARRWRAHTPGCDPSRALQLMRPVIELLYAVVYANFVDQIEPSEWPYHSSDVPHHLGRAVAVAQEQAAS